MTRLTTSLCSLWKGRPTHAEPGCCYASDWQPVRGAHGFHTGQIRDPGHDLPSECDGLRVLRVACERLVDLKRGQMIGLHPDVGVKHAVETLRKLPPTASAPGYRVEIVAASPLLAGIGFAKCCSGVARSVVQNSAAAFATRCSSRACLGVDAAFFAGAKIAAQDRSAAKRAKEASAHARAGHQLRTRGGAM